MKTQYPIVPGSISALAQQQGKSIAESFINADVIVIVDTSGSMSDNDSRGGKSRYEVANEELIQLQANLPGKIAVISFSSDAVFCPAGVTQYIGGGTDLTRALKFARVADVPDMRFILISDGEPDSPTEAMQEARKYKNRIDVVYVGPEDRPAGRAFLQQLAAATGGQTVTMDRAKELGAGVQYLLNSGR